MSEPASTQENIANYNKSIAYRALLMKKLDPEAFEEMQNIFGSVLRIFRFAQLKQQIDLTKESPTSISPLLRATGSTLATAGIVLEVGQFAFSEKGRQAAGNLVYITTGLQPPGFRNRFKDHRDELDAAVTRFL